MTVEEVKSLQDHERRAYLAALKAPQDKGLWKAWQTVRHVLYMERKEAGMMTLHMGRER